MSGFVLLVLVYYVGAEFYLIDLEKMELQVWQAVGISVASLGLGWVIYDQLCKSRFGEDNTRLMVNSCSFCWSSWHGATRRFLRAARRCCIWARSPPRSCRGNVFFHSSFRTRRSLSLT